MDTQRRSLLIGAAATMALSIPARAWAAALSLDDFIQLSAQVCQHPPASLDRDMARRILQILVDQGKTAALQALVQNQNSQPALATELRAVWFTGLINTSSGIAVVGFLHALTWHSADFLHAPGSCGGATGYWSHAPQSHTA